MRITTHKQQLPFGHRVYYCIVHQGDFIRDSDSIPLRFTTRSEARNYRKHLGLKEATCWAASNQETQPNA